MSHRLAEWCTNAPELEDEVALANIALDLLGQARLLLSRSAQAAEAGDEDTLAYGRDEHEFRNVRLAELERGDFAHEITRLLVFATWRIAILARLVDSPDPVLSAIAAKGVKELAYHRDYAAGWAVRLGDGTDLSHARMAAATAAVWPYVAELFEPHDVERSAGVDPRDVRGEFDAVVAEVFAAARLTVPDLAEAPGGSGREGVHTEAMRALLAEMQSVARAHPDATW
jgi:ring-1,2-phenylacetyl-CoA epoxidase subunit PaaC